MRIIGITGGVGSGKSQVLRYLKDTFCASIYEADEIARKLQAPGQICYAKMVEQFGREILLDGGEVNREKLAAMVFDDAGKLHQLNEIVHPAVKAYVQEQIAWERNRGTRLFVLEAALLLEDKYDAICDELWYIYTEESVRRERLKISRGYPDEKITAIIQNQAKESVYEQGCQIRIDNSHDFSQTCAQIDGILKAQQF